MIATNVLGGLPRYDGTRFDCRGRHGVGFTLPEISIRDQVAAEVALADVLGIERFSSVIGGRWAACGRST